VFRKKEGQEKGASSCRAYARAYAQLRWIVSFTSARPDVLGGPLKWAYALQGASPKTVYHHFNRWSKQRVFKRAFEDLRSKYLTLPRKALIADCSFVKNIYGRCVVGRNPTDRGRKATKVSLLADERGHMPRRPVASLLPSR
jgi:hypothetical protein